MIGVLSGCVSDRHLGWPVVLALRGVGLESELVSLAQNDVSWSFNIVHDFIKRRENMPDQFRVKFVLAVGDRPEQLGGVLAAFHNRIPVGHLFAGDVNFPVSCFDDVHRHAITLYSCIQFCSSEESKTNVCKLMGSVNLSANAYVVGFTHFDGVDFDKVRKEREFKKPYILVLVNAETLGNNYVVINETVEAIEHFYLDSRKVSTGCDVLIAKGNGDMDVEKLVARRLDDCGIDYKLLPRLEHERFLSLMMHCDKFITNGSCAVYESPFLMSPEDVVFVGSRNFKRTSVFCDCLDEDGTRGAKYINRTQYASGRIAELIKEGLI